MTQQDSEDGYNNPFTRKNRSDLKINIEKSTLHFVVWIFCFIFAVQKIKNMINLNVKQRIKLNKLWFIYGNKGVKHTHCNHRFIQNILEHGEDTEEFYRSNPYKCDLTEECVKEVREILNEK